MKMLKGLLLCCLVFVVHCQETGEPTDDVTTDITTDEPTPPVTTSKPTNPPTTQPPTKPPTTEAPTTEAPTTQAPTTQPPTTQPPTTQQPTTSAPPTSTAAPEAAGDWSVNYADKNGSCIHLKMQASLNILYPTKSNTNDTATINIMSNAKPTKDSTCVGVQALALNFDDVVTLKFVFNKTDDGVFVQEIYCKFKMVEKYFPNASDPDVTKEANMEGPLYIVGNGKSWKCDDPKPVETEGVTLNLKNFQYQAYTDEGTKGDNFLSEENCVDQGNDVVPIVVGCALAALVLIVLIAYLIGRRRSRQKAEYQSM